MKKLTTKGLVMTAIIFISTAVAGGFPATWLQWEVLGLTLAGTLAGYIAQSVYFPSTSMQGDLNWKDAVKALLINASNVLSTVGAAAITDTSINWMEIFKSILVLTIGYIGKQLVTPPTGIPPTK